MTSRYQKSVEWTKEGIAYLELLNNRYESIRQDCSEKCKKQIKELEAKLKSPNTNITAIGCLITGAGMSRLTKPYIGSEQSFSIILNQNNLKSEELTKVMPDLQKKLLHAYAKHCFNL